MLKIPKKLSHLKTIFQGEMLFAKIDFAVGEQEKAIQKLSDMLSDTKDAENRGELHYELWKMNQKEEHRKKALELYQKLYEKNPVDQYKKSIAQKDDAFAYLILFFSTKP